MEAPRQPRQKAEENPSDYDESDQDGKRDSEPDDDGDAGMVASGKLSAAKAALAAFRSGDAAALSRALSAHHDLHTNDGGEDPDAGESGDTGFEGDKEPASLSEVLAAQGRKRMRM